MERKNSESQGVPGHLTHPSDEQLVEALYGELPAGGETRLKEHLAHCPSCADKVAGWRGAMRSLDEWEWTAGGPAKRRPARWTGWSAAAGLLLLAGLAGQIAWATSAASKSEQRVEASVRGKVMATLRDETARIVETEIGRANLVHREELQSLAESVAAATTGESRRLLADFVQSADARQLADYRQIHNQILQIENARAKEYQKLRQDLETVAVLTETGLRRAQDQIVTLASFTETPANPRER